MTTPAPVYDRAPSRELLALFAEGKILAPVLQLARRNVGGHLHDVQFRVDDYVYVYRGHTAVLKIRRYKQAGDLKIEAAKKYEDTQLAKGIFRRWSIDDNNLGWAICDYLDKVDVEGSLTLGEGDIQQRWSEVTQPWTPFDREAVLSYRKYAGSEERENAKKFAQVAEAGIDLAKLRLAKLPNTGGKLDQLAIDPQGRLVVLELKDGSNTNDKVYYSPFQLLHYVWEWHNALPAVRANLQAVIDARKKVGLTPPNLPALTGGIRAAVGFGFDSPRSDTKRNYARVLDVVNQHLPEGVEPIETWELTGSGPRLVG